MAETPREQDQANESIRNLISSGAEIAGAAVGAALGFLAGGPAGAALLGAGGVVAAITLKHIGREAADRLLGPREKVRVGGVLAIAAAEIDERLKKGEAIRSDNFFKGGAAGQSDAEQVAESVLFKSQREPEEKKIPYMAHLLSNIAFNGEVSAAMAHQIIKIAESLTYRQLCILKLATVKEQFGLRTTNYRSQSSLPKELYQVLYECLDLYRRGLINFGGEAVLDPTDVRPGGMTVQGLGIDLFNLMSLAKIPNQDLLPTAGQLR